MLPPLLSVIIISHNQRSELRRCVDSVLAQDIPFEYEIILSDDRSTDGTFELAKEYAARFPFITASQCNSDECNPANNSQRSGWNRCNGYKLAKGKYIAHVDADDYFRPGSKVYEKQVMMLERHPECSLCMENVCELVEGAPEDTGTSWHKRKFDDGQILTKEEYIKNELFILNQAFVQRRNPDVDPVELYGKRYVDSVITYHHLQFGDIVCVDNCDYIYMKHPGAVTTTMKSEDQTILWNLAVYISALIPNLADTYIKYNGAEYLRMINLVRHGHRISDSAKLSISDMDVFVYKCVNKAKLSFYEKSRLNLARAILVVQQKWNITSKLARKLIFSLVIK